MAIRQLNEEQVRTMTPEQKDQWWLDNVWKGDMPQLTIRSALTGMILGSVLSLTNLTGADGNLPCTMELRVRDVTNYGGLSLPTHVEVIRKVFDSDPPGRVLGEWRVQLNTARVFPGGSLPASPPPLPTEGASRVIDLSFVQGTRGQAISLTTNQWPALATIEGIQERIAPAPPRIPRLLLAALLIAVILGPAVALYRSHLHK